MLMHSPVPEPMPCFTIARPWRMLHASQHHPRALGAWTWIHDLAVTTTSCGRRGISSSPADGFFYPSKNVMYCKFHWRTDRRAHLAFLTASLRRRCDRARPPIPPQPRFSLSPWLTFQPAPPRPAFPPPPSLPTPPPTQSPHKILPLPLPLPPPPNRPPPDGSRKTEPPKWLCCLRPRSSGSVTAAAGDSRAGSVWA